MNVIQTDIQGVVIIEPRIFGDSRGYFFESFSEKKFKELVADVDCLAVVNGGEAAAANAHSLKGSAATLGKEGLRIYNVFVLEIEDGESCVGGNAEALSRIVAE